MKESLLKVYLTFIIVMSIDIMLYSLHVASLELR